MTEPHELIADGGKSQNLSTPMQSPNGSFSKDEMEAEKRKLKISLAKFEAEFEKEHQRKPTRGDRGTRCNDYKRYAELKLLLGCQYSDLVCSPQEVGKRL